MRKAFVLVRDLLVTGNKSSIQPKTTGRNGGWGDCCKVVVQSHRNLGNIEQSGLGTRKIEVALWIVTLYFHPLHPVIPWSIDFFWSRITCWERHKAWLSGAKVTGRLPACNAGDTVSIPWWGRAPEEGNSNPHQYSYLRNPMDRKAWWATVHGVTELDMRLKNNKVRGRLPDRRA